MVRAPGLVSRRSAVGGAVRVCVVGVRVVVLLAAEPAGFRRLRVVDADERRLDGGLGGVVGGVVSLVGVGGDRVHRRLLPRAVAATRCGRWPRRAGCRCGMRPWGPDSKRWFWLQSTD